MKKKYLLISLIALIFVGIFAFVGLSYFKISSIKLDGQTQSDPRFAEFLGKNLFGVSKQELLSKLNSPRIMDCKISKTWPGTITISPILRKDFFLLKVKSSYIPLSKEKIVMEFQGYSPVPIIDLDLSNYSVGDTIKNQKIDQIYTQYEQILAGDPAFAEKISEFFYDGEKLYFLKSSPTNFVCLGEAKILDKIKKLKSLEKSIDLKNKMIDLSYKNQLIYKESSR